MRVRQSFRSFSCLYFVVLAAMVMFSGTIAAGEGYSYLSLKATGADRFVAQHPTFDGRGVVIFVLDNGADVGVPGLLTTTTGEPKFIDARDFTGEGDVELEEAERGVDGSLSSEDGELRVTGIEKLPMIAEGGAYWIGVLEEERFRNSEYEEVTGSVDINDNGEDDDVFAVVAYAVEGADYWVAFVDTDADGALDDEEMHRSFIDDLKELHFQRQLPEKQTRPMTLALTVDPEEHVVVFHYPDGDHSTHVSGIAAGHEIEGQKGFNGVAPGAQVVSLKIGDGTLSGGATVTESMKAAYEHIRSYATEHDDEVVIVNMSYGVGSEVEGASAIDRYIDELLHDHPNIILCTSAGNEGPGVSTIGTPAAAPLVISVAAVMTADTARDAYGAELCGHRLLHFSSRGGELDKPDIAAPGACLSTVPRWSENSRFWGTSMASPYMAGVMALLVSAAEQTFPERKVNIGMLRRAVQNSADPLEGCDALGQGCGMVNVPRAWELLRSWLSCEADPVLDYAISTLCPSAPRGKSRAAFWRSVYYPREDGQLFRVSPVFLPGTPAEQINDFFRSVDLESTVPFLRAVQDSVALRQDQQTQIRVHFDPAKLAEPGLYCGRIRAYRGAKIAANREFDVQCTVVVPYTFGPQNDYRLNVRDATCEPLEPRHYFLAVPPGATRLSIETGVPEGRHANCRIELFDPAGRSHAYLSPLRSSVSALESTTSVDENDIEPGVWELVVWGDYRAGKTSHYDLDVEFMGFHVEDASPLSLEYSPGHKPRGSFTITNLYNKAVWTSATGQVWGYRRTLEQHLEETDEFNHTFSLDEGLQGVQFAIEMSPEDYGLFTDFAINILDQEGTSLLKEGLSYRKTEFFFPNPGGRGTYTLQLIAGFTHADLAPFDFTLKEMYLHESTIPVRVRYVNGDAQIPLVPGIPTKIGYTLEGVPPVAPQGFATAATLIFKERGTDEEVLRVRMSSAAAGGR